MEPTVRVDRRGPVLTLTLDSPGNRNALSAALLGQLAAGLEQGDADATVRAIVVSGAGPVFCSGADLAERLGPPERIPGPAGANMPHVLRAMRHSGTPIVARVNGPARGGGLGLIAAADVAVSTRAAHFAFTEVRVGVAPAMIAPPVLGAVQSRFLSRYLLTGETFGADEARAAGLLSAVVDDEPALDAWVDRLCTEILKTAPHAVGVTRSLVRDLADQSFDEGLTHATSVSELLFGGEEAAEGMAAFLEKRPAAWVTELP